MLKVYGRLLLRNYISLSTILQFVSLNFQKRPCLEDFSWRTENASNLETENRLLNCTQPMVVANQLHECTDQPLSDHNSAAYSHMDINCNILYQVNNTQEMDISCDATIIRSPAGLHQQNYAVSDFFLVYGWFTLVFTLLK